MGKRKKMRNRISKSWKKECQTNTTTRRRRKSRIRNHRTRSFSKPSTILEMTQMTTADNLSKEAGVTPSSNVPFTNYPKRRLSLLSAGDEVQYDFDGSVVFRILFFSLSLFPGRSLLLGLPNAFHLQEGFIVCSGVLNIVIGLVLLKISEVKAPNSSFVDSPESVWVLICGFA